MGIGVTLDREFLAPGKFVLHIEENNASVGTAILDQGDGPRRFLNPSQLPQKLYNAGIYYPPITDESVCYNNAIHPSQRGLYDLYEFDSSGGSGTEFKYFPGWEVSRQKNIPSYIEDDFRKGLKCKFSRINRIPTKKNIKNCCLRKETHCPHQLTTYGSSTCDYTMTDHCIYGNNIWNDSLCQEWIDQKMGRPDSALYDALKYKAERDFAGKWGLFLWELSAHNSDFKLIHDAILKEFCKKDREECACYNKKGNEQIAEQFDKIEAPIECVSATCKNVHPRFMPESSRIISSQCKTLNCKIDIQNLTGDNSGKIQLNNQCGSFKPTIRSFRPEPDYTPTDFLPAYKFSIVFVVLFLGILWGLFFS